MSDLLATGGLEAAHYQFLGMLALLAACIGFIGGVISVGWKWRIGWKIVLSSLSGGAVVAVVVLVLASRDGLEAWVMAVAGPIFLIGGSAVALGGFAVGRWVGIWSTRLQEMARREESDDAEPGATAGPPPDCEWQFDRRRTIPGFVSTSIVLGFIVVLITLSPPESVLPGLFLYGVGLFMLYTWLLLIYHLSYPATSLLFSQEGFQWRVGRATIRTAWENVEAMEMMGRYRIGIRFTDLEKVVVDQPPARFSWRDAMVLLSLILPSLMMAALRRKPRYVASVFNRSLRNDLERNVDLVNYNLVFSKYQFNDLDAIAAYGRAIVQCERESES